MLASVGIAITLALMYFQWKNIFFEPKLETAHKSSSNSFSLIRDVCMFIPFFSVTSVIVMASVMGFAAENPEKHYDLFQICALWVSIFIFFFSQQVAWVRLGATDRIENIIRWVLSFIVFLGGAGVLAWFVPSWISILGYLAVTTLIILRVSATHKRFKKSQNKTNYSFLLLREA